MSLYMLAGLATITPLASVIQWLFDGRSFTCPFQGFCCFEMTSDVTKRSWKHVGTVFSLDIKVQEEEMNLNIISMLHIVKKKKVQCMKDQRVWLKLIVRYMQLSAVVCHFAVQKRLLIFQNLHLRDPSITVLVHFLQKVESLSPCKKKLLINGENESFVSGASGECLQNHPAISGGFVFFPSRC